MEVAGFLDTVSFPKLGLYFLIDNVAFEVFGKEVYWYGILIAIGFTLAVLYALYRTKKVGLTQDNVIDLALIGLPLAIVCARLFYVLGDIEGLGGNFWNVFAVWNGGLSIYGGLIGAALTGIIYSRVKKINMGKLFDFAVPSLMIGQAIGRWGNFFNCEVFGGVTNLPWGMQINGGDPVHPLFLYESLWMTLGLILALIYQDKKKRHGEMFCLYMIWYSGARMFMELMRDPAYILKVGNVPLSFVTAIATLLIAVVILIIVFKKGQPVNLAKEVLGAEIELKRKTLDALIEKNADEAEVLEASKALDEKISEYMKM